MPKDSTAIKDSATLCSNTLLACDACPPQPPVYAWKYNMAAHYALRHVGQELPPKYAIGPQEKKAMDSRASNMKR